MFRIKICGVTRPADAALAAAAGADALGLNFYPGSKRCIDLATAHSIRETARAAAARPPAIVGVFVNAAVEEVHRTAAELSLDYVQLHGDEPPEYLAELAGLRVIRAFRCREGGLAPLESYLARCASPPAAVLLDAYAAEAYGGTGRRVDWSPLAAYAGAIAGLPLILAGGLHAENVAAAIETARPAAVDTASGVESSPGVKDAAAVRAFVDGAIRGFSATDEHR